MNPIAIFVGILLLGAAMMFVLNPFRAKSRFAFPKTPATVSAQESHTAALAALRDLDFDFRTGKVSEEDYPGLRAQWMVEAAKSAEAESKDDDQLEALIRARKQAIGHPKRCPKCQNKLDAGARFCPNCGTDLGLACPSCGKVVLPGDLYCRSCGGKLAVHAEAMA